MLSKDFVKNKRKSKIIIDKLRDIHYNNNRKRGVFRRRFYGLKRPRSASLSERKENMVKCGLSNPASNEKTRRIYEYICDSFGKRIITAQQESVWVKGSEYEMEHLRAVTGKLPAMRGLDFKDNDFEGVAERSKEWSRRGGLVTICWHTGVGISGYPESKEEVPDFERLFTEGTEENRASYLRQTGGNQEYFYR